MVAASKHAWEPDSLIVETFVAEIDFVVAVVNEGSFTAPCPLITSEGTVTEMESTNSLWKK